MITYERNVHSMKGAMAEALKKRAARLINGSEDFWSEVALEFRNGKIVAEFCGCVQEIGSV